MAMREFKSKPGRKAKADPAAVRAWLEANDFHFAGASKHFGVRPNSLYAVNRKWATTYGLIVNPSRPKKTTTPAPEEQVALKLPPVVGLPPLSPAMRHLAQFDPIIRQRLALEQAQ